MNQVRIVGKISKPPYRGRGGVVLLKIAAPVDRDRDQPRLTTVPVTIFDLPAETAEQLQPGLDVELHGIVNESSYIKDGQRVWSTNVEARGEDLRLAS